MTPGEPPRTSSYVRIWDSPDGGRTFGGDTPPPAGPPPRPPAPKNRRARWVGLVAAVLGLAMIGGVVWYFDPAGDRRSAGVVGGAGTTPSGPPAAGDRRAFARYQIDQTLRGQAAALLGGDEAGWLAVTDPGAATKVGDRLRHWFRSFRAMRATVFTLAADRLPTEEAGRWRVQVDVGYCFVDAGCKPTPMPMVTIWTVDERGQARLYDFAEPGQVELRPRPWEQGDLVAKAGNRVLVVAAPSMAARVDETLAAADRAAVVDDRFGPHKPPPGRYVIFLPGTAEYPLWYGRDLGAGVAGVAWPVGPDTVDVVLNPAIFGVESLDDLLRHEMAHVITLHGAPVSGPFWLREGMAEYVAYAGVPITRYPWLPAVQAFLKSGRWDGTIEIDRVKLPRVAASGAVAYGLSHLVVRHIAEQYGEAKLLDFFDAVMHGGEGVEVAATRILGVPYGEMAADCVKYVQSVAGPAPPPSD